MPRAGWLALGAMAAALGATQALLPSGIVSVLLALAALVAAAGLGVGRRWRSFALVFGFATVLARAALPSLVTGPPPEPGPPPVGVRAFVAEVLSTGAARDGLARGTLLLRPDPADTGWLAPLPPAGWRVYATLPRYPALVPGDRFVFSGTIEPPPDDGSGFADYLLRGGFAGTLRVHRLSDVRHGQGAIAALETHRRAAADLLARAIPEPEGGLAAGILIGIRERVSRDVSDAFATTGLSHVVAISGWNIALVGGVVGGLLAAAGLGRRSRSMLVVVAIALYTLLSGASASVVRAALMGGVAIAARATGRPGTAAAALGVAVWTLVLAEPAMAADIGFQLSVTATAGLLAWGDRISAWLQALGGGRCPPWLAETLGVSLAAQLATLPLVLLHFGRLSLISPLANLLVAPLVAPAMAVSLLGLLAGAAVTAGVPSLLVAPVALAARLVLGGMIAIADLLAGVPLASVTLPAPLDLAGGAAGLALVVLAVRRRSARVPPARALGTQTVADRHSTRPERRPGERPDTSGRAHRGPRAGIVVGVGAAALVLVGAVAIAGKPEARLTVTVLDVGQGDAILVEGPRGSRILVDGGPDPDRLIAVLDERLPPWDRRIDLVLLTHPHEDHVAGFALLMERYRVGRVAENGMLGTGPGDAAFRERLVAEGRSAARLAAGDHLRLDDATARAWWPRRGEVPERSPKDGRAVNDTSIVLDLRYGERRFLLMGDVEDDVDPELLAAGIADDGRVDLLKVAHHGSRTASTEAFLAALRPRVAVTSAGTGNRYGHPAPATLARLEAAGARVLGTDTDGSVTVSTDGRDLRVRTSGGRPTASLPRSRTLTIPELDGSPAFLALPCLIPTRAPTAVASARAVPAASDTPAERGTDDPRTSTAVPDRPLLAVPEGRPIASGFPCYDRQRDDPHPVRRGRHPARPRRGSHAHPAHVGGGGDRRVPRGACSRPWRLRRPRARGARGAASRPGQGAARDEPAAPSGPRPRRRRVAPRP